MPQKIHFVQLSAGPGGIEVLLPKQAKELPGFTIKAFVIREKPTGTNVYDNSVVEVQYGHKRNIIAGIRLLFYVFSNRKDIFHAFSIGPLFLLIMKLGGARNIIYSIHGTIYWKSNFKKKILYLLWQLALSPRYKFTANSAYSKSVFLDKVNSKQDIRVIYNPIDVKRFTPLAGPRDRDEILIVYTGRLSEGKNLLKWIDIAVQLHSKLPKTRFEIYGQGSLEAVLRKKISEAKAEKYILLMGFRKDIESIYQNADLLLFLSEYESFGNVVVESIMCGTPVLVSPLPAMKEIFSEFPQFVLGQEKDWVEEIYNGIVRLPELNRYAENARKIFLQRFDFETSLNMQAKMYNEFE